MCRRGAAADELVAAKGLDHHVVRMRQLDFQDETAKPFQRLFVHWEKGPCGLMMGAGISVAPGACPTRWSDFPSGLSALLLALAALASLKYEEVYLYAYDTVLFCFNASSP